MTAAKFAKLLAQLTSDESDMRRAFNKWNKTRKQVERAEKTLNKKDRQRLNDWRDLADGARPEIHP
jgi:hypothetical protein